MGWQILVSNVQTCIVFLRNMLSYSNWWFHFFCFFRSSTFVNVHSSSSPIENRCSGIWGKWKSDILLVMRFTEEATSRCLRCETWLCTLTALSAQHTCYIVCSSFFHPISVYTLELHQQRPLQMNFCSQNNHQTAKCRIMGFQQHHGRLLWHVVVSLYKDWTHGMKCAVLISCFWGFFIIIPHPLIQWASSAQVNRHQ